MKLEDYSEGIGLRERRPRPDSFSSPAESRQTVTTTVEFLLGEARWPQALPLDPAEQRRLLRALLNARPPAPLPDDVRGELDRLLWTERIEAGIVDPNDILSVRDALGYRGRHGETLSLWRGDITRLGADAIVNAANDNLLGCFLPLHSCIDNAIHSAAGPQLRDDCATIMTLLGDPEATGRARITRAHNLPARFVLHTVGPIVTGRLTDREKTLLADSYRACLELAAKLGGIDSVAFCCISTGVYGFPADAAAPLAVTAVTAWLDRNPGCFRKVIFDVFGQEDEERYRRVFSR